MQYIFDVNSCSKYWRHTCALFIVVWNVSLCFEFIRDWREMSDSYFDVLAEELRDVLTRCFTEFPQVWDLNKMLHCHFLSLSLARSLFLLPSHSLFSSIKRPLPTHFFSLISFFSYAVFLLWILCSPLSLYGYYGDVQIGVIDQAERSSCIMQTD